VELEYAAQLYMFGGKKYTILSEATSEEHDKTCELDKQQCIDITRSILTVAILEMGKCYRKFLNELLNYYFMAIIAPLIPYPSDA